MCRAATCKRCGKATWKGCGMHVEQVLGGVAKHQRCSCNAGNPAASATAVAAGAAPKRRWFARRG